MPLRIKSSDLKAATRLTSRIKDVEELDDKTLYWSTVHRLVATREKLRLLTTDNDVHLDWSIELDETDGDEFDLIVPAVQFNTVANNCVGGPLFEIHHDADVLTLSQKTTPILTRDSHGQSLGPDRILRIRPEEVTATYPTPPGQTGTKWTTRAELLAQALAFMAPYVGDDDKDVDQKKKVVSWLAGGDVIAGNSHAFGFVTGLDSPPVSLNLKQGSARVVSAFLEALGGEVEIDVAGTVATFRCPSAGHTLVVPVEEVSFPQLFKDQEKWDHEVFRTEGTILRNALKTLGVLGPREKECLELRLSGDGQSSAIYLSTLVEPGLQSRDVIPSVGRKQDMNTPGVEAILPDGSFADTVIPVPWESLSNALKSLDSVTVELKYFPDPRGKGFDYIRVYSVEQDNQHPVRSLLLLVGRGVMGAYRPAPTPEEHGEPGQATEQQPPSPPVEEMGEPETDQPRRHRRPVSANGSSRT